MLLRTPQLDVYARAQTHDTLHARCFYAPPSRQAGADAASLAAAKARHRAACCPQGDCRRNAHATGSARGRSHARLLLARSTDSRANRYCKARRERSSTPTVVLLIRSRASALIRDVAQSCNVSMCHAPEGHEHDQTRLTHATHAARRARQSHAPERHEHQIRSVRSDQIRE